MPSLLKTKPDIPFWKRPSKTQIELDWAPLVTVDLAEFDEPLGKQKLANSLRDAIQKWGFWVVTGTGIPDDLVLRQFAIASSFFSLPLEEKKKYPCDFSIGNYFGYREPTRFVGNSEVKENMEMFNMPKFISEHTSVPQTDFIRGFHDEIEAFQRLVFDKVVRKLMILFAVLLELPEEYFLERHAYDLPSEDHLRYMIYHPRSEVDDAKINGQWSPGHTDFGSLTLLFSQNIAALQIRTPSDEWKWVKPLDGSIVCNAADTLSFMTKGYIKSTIHRVVRPPPDQASLDRLGLFYFVRPGNDVPIVPAPSPLLIREGYLTEEELARAQEDPVKGIDYVRARVKNVHHVARVRTAKNADRIFKVGDLKVPDTYA